MTTLSELKRIAAEATQGTWAGSFEDSWQDTKYRATFNPALVTKLLAVVDAAKEYNFHPTHMGDKKLTNALAALENEEC